MFQPYTTLITAYLSSLLAGLCFYDFPLLALEPISNSPVQRRAAKKQLPARSAPRTRIKPFTPSNPGLPGRRQAGSSRPLVGKVASLRPDGNLCFPSAKPLTALIPATNLGLSVDPYPTFFVYVPQTLARAMEFVLIDEEQGNEVYKKTLALTGKPGIVSLSLADAKISPLKIGKNYHWYFSVICDSEDRAGDVYVDGWIQRVQPSPTLVLELKNASPQAQVDIYRKYGIWQETLTTLAEARRSQPNSSALAADWANLLNSVGLTEIAREQLTP